MLNFWKQLFSKSGSSQLFTQNGIKAELLVQKNKKTCYDPGNFIWPKTQSRNDS